jgi:hypothetical protein
MSGAPDESTRVSLHAIAEGVLAGPQLAESGTIRLRVLQGGFATVAAPMLRLSGASLVRSDGQRLALEGTFAELAQAAGVAYHVPDIYSDHAPVAATDAVTVEPQAVVEIAAWFERGRQSLVATAPGQTPVLWPEHFDVAVTVDEVNLGVSAGDGFSTRPYAYVGPWDFDPDVPAYGGGGFWNAPFGAVLEPPARPGPAPLTEFFRAGLERVRRGRRRGL